jgi:hypothetical protein
MSRKTTYFATEELLYQGRAYRRGEEISIEGDELRDQLADEDRISTTKPSPEPLPGPTSDAAAPAVTLADFSDEELLAEVAERGLVTEESKVAYAELSIEDLQKLAKERDLEVKRGDGKKGNPLQADYVAALEAADAADNA